MDDTHPRSLISISPKFDVIAVLAILALVIALPVYHDISRFYLANSDQDIDLTYHALFLANGFTLEYFPHTAYFYTVVLAAILIAGEAVGIISTINLPSMIASDRFDDLYLEIIIAGRVFSIFLASLMTLLCRRLIWVVTGDRFVALVGAFLIATSLGLSSQSNVIRSELPAMVLILAGMITLVQALRTERWPSVGWMFLTGQCLHLAIMVKTQSVFLVIGLPVLPFLIAWKPGARWAAGKPSALITANLAFLIIALPALVWMRGAISGNASGSYQILITVYLAAAIAGFAWYRNIPKAWAATGTMALLAGIGLAQYFNLIGNVWWTTASVVNFVESMMPWSNAVMGNIPDGSMETRFRHVLEHPTTESTLVDILRNLPSYNFDFFHGHLSPWALLRDENVFALIYWAALAGGLGLLAVKRYRTFLLVMFFLGIAIGLPTLFQVRGYFYFYAIYVEAWAIFAFCIAVWGLAGHVGKPMALVTLAVILSLFVGGFQTRYRNLAPSTANTRPLDAVCQLRQRTPFIYEKIMPYCKKALAAKKQG